MGRLRRSMLVKDKPASFDNLVQGSSRQWRRWSPCKTKGAILVSAELSDKMEYRCTMGAAGG